MADTLKTTEFDLIRRYFMRPTRHTSLAGGDDAALIELSPGMQLAVSTDMLVAGTHFFADVAPYLLGWKTLAVNISDMAAMGALPRWATLSLALPEVDEPWLEEFARGFYACADAFNVDLAGGDTTRGPLTLNVQIMGEVPADQALRRSGAQLSDEIWVSGTLGEAALALAAMQKRVLIADHELESCRRALEQPQPRVALGLALRGIANSAIDISDGLLADLGHILKCSHLGAELQLADIPRSSIVDGYLHLPEVINMLLSGGDDYELCFTAPASQHASIAAIGHQLGLQLSHIGYVTSGSSLLVRDQHGQLVDVQGGGFDHFA